MFETIVSGLLLAAITGITVLAYKHPHAYRRLLVITAPICAAMLIGMLFLACLAMNSMLDIAVSMAEEFPDRTLETAAGSLGGIKQVASFAAWSLGIGIASGIYLTFLWFLPSLVHPRREDMA